MGSVEQLKGRYDGSEDGERRRQSRDGRAGWSSEETRAAAMMDFGVGMP